MKISVCSIFFRVMVRSDTIICRLHSFCEYHAP